MLGRLFPPLKYQPYKEIYQSSYSRNTCARFHYFQTGLLQFTFVWTAETNYQAPSAFSKCSCQNGWLTLKHEHISPVLQELHCLPTEQPIIFKIILMTFKCLNGIAPSYLSDLVTRYIPRRNLRSVNGHRLFDVKYNLRNNGFRSFSIVSPQLWNNMPLGIRSCASLNDFKKKVKTNLFRKAF